MHDFPLNVIFWFLKNFEPTKQLILLRSFSLSYLTKPTLFCQVCPSLFG